MIVSYFDSSKIKLLNTYLLNEICELECIPDMSHYEKCIIYKEEQKNP